MRTAVLPQHLPAKPAGQREHQPAESRSRKCSSHWILSVLDESIHSGLFTLEH
jgi:hypothetical protein